MMKPEDARYMFRDLHGEWQEMPVEIMELLITKYGLVTVLCDKKCEPKVEFCNA